MILVSLISSIVIWSSVILFDLIWSVLIRISVSQVNLIRMFALNFFNFKKFLTPRVVENIVANRVLTSPCIMTHRVTVDEIRHSSKGEVCTVNLWYYGSDGYLWVHPNEFINTPPGCPASDISATFQNTNGGVPITVSPSGCLVGVDGGWFSSRVVLTRSLTYEGVRDYYRELLRPSSFDPQWELSRLFRHHIPRGIFPKRIGQ